MKRLLTMIAAAAMLASANAKADITVTVTENPSGGTNWSFSGGSGTVAGSGSHFLPGATPANPQPFHAADDEGLGVSVLAGTNVFAIENIFVRNYGGLSGTNGDIFDGLDFQTFSPVIGGLSIASLNGLVLYADDFDIASLNAGTYVLNSYYAPYNTDLGTFTLIVGLQSIPEPATLALLGAGLLGLGAVRRRSRV